MDLLDQLNKLKQEQTGQKTTKKQALGRGLASLLPQEEGTDISMVNVEKIRPNHEQPRRHFDKERLESLAKSIKESGILQPIIVRESGEKGQYEIIAGERRWRAAQQAALDKIPVIIRSAKKNERLEIALIENVQRENLNPLEEALAYKRMAQEFGYSHETIAEKVGKDRTSVTNYIRLLQLPPSVQDMVRTETLTMGHARALLSVNDPKQVESLAREIARKRLSVREAEAGVKKRRPTGKAEKKSPEIARLEEDLQRRYSRKVHIHVTSRNKGTISFDYSSLDDMNRLLRLLNRPRS